MKRIWLRWTSPSLVIALMTATHTYAGDYSDAVSALNPTHYYRLNETTVGTVFDTGSSPINGVHEGIGDGGINGAVGVDGPDVLETGEILSGFEVGNKAMYTNQTLAVNLGNGANFGHPTMTLASWFKVTCVKGDPLSECQFVPASDGGDRLFTNQIPGASTGGTDVDDMGHFQVVLGAGANLVVSIDNRFGDPPTPDPLHSNFQVPHLNNHPGPFGSAGPGSGLAVKNESWHHIVVSRNGDQVSNIILVVDGKNITQDRWADSTDSWGITGSDAKIGTRSTAPDAQTWNGWIDEQSLWIGRQLSIKESQILFHAALGYESADFDDNSTINGADVNALVADIVAGNNTPSFDLTKDGAVNAQDLDLWLSLAGGNNIGAGRAYLPGDANLDGVVDGTDFGLWNSNKFTGNTEWTRGNFNADSVTDGSDFGVWNSNKFTASDSTLVPEPSSLISILAGVGLLMVRRRHTNCQR